MNYSFDTQKFKQYFHYGLNYDKNDILDAIILNCSKDKDFQFPNERVHRLEYQMDAVKSLYLQFKRFIDLTSNQQQQWYQKLTKKDVESEIMQRISELKSAGFLDYVTYFPMSGLYTSGGKKTSYVKLEPNYSMLDYLTNKPLWGVYVEEEANDKGTKRLNSIEKWIREDILPILKYLHKLEIENPYQYCSLFMDTKYARIMNCEGGYGSDKTKVLYQRFMDMVKPAKDDVYQFFPNKPTQEQEDYMRKNCADYWTVTDLKQQSKSDKYMQKVQHCFKTIQELEEREFD